jgi:hypothetical protein
MPQKHTGVPKDVNQLAARVAAISTGRPPPQLSAAEQKRLRSEAASILGKLGGSKGGKARAASLSANRRTEIAKQAAVARWGER